MNDGPLNSEQQECENDHVVSAERECTDSSPAWTGRRIIRTIYAVIGGGVAGFVIPIVCCVLLGYLLIWLQLGEGLVVMLSFLPIMLSPCGGVIGMVVGLQRINQSYREQ